MREVVQPIPKAQQKTHLFKKLTLTRTLGDQFKSGGGEGALSHADVILESGVRMTFAKLI